MSETIGSGEGTKANSAENEHQATEICCCEIREGIHTPAWTFYAKARKEGEVMNIKMAYFTWAVTLDARIGVAVTWSLVLAEVECLEPSDVITRQTGQKTTIFVRGKPHCICQDLELRQTRRVQIFSDDRANAKEQTASRTNGNKN